LKADPAPGAPRAPLLWRELVWDPEVGFHVLQEAAPAQQAAPAAAPPAAPPAAPEAPAATPPAAPAAQAAARGTYANVVAGPAPPAAPAALNVAPAPAQKQKLKKEKQDPEKQKKKSAPLMKLSRAALEEVARRQRGAVHRQGAGPDPPAEPAPAAADPAGPAPPAEPADPADPAPPRRSVFERLGPKVSSHFFPLFQCWTTSN
jgi:hypothetical protein